MLHTFLESYRSDLFVSLLLVIAAVSARRGWVAERKLAAR
jgi:hypothetical protein